MKNKESLVKNREILDKHDFVMKDSNIPFFLSSYLSIMFINLGPHEANLKNKKFVVFFLGKNVKKCLQNSPRICFWVILDARHIQSLLIDFKFFPPNVVVGTVIDL